jgi:methyl-accepting chemotaxis protein
MSSLADMERALENLDRRLRGVEQLLPTLATKADLDRFATRADLESGLAQVRAFAEQVRDEVRVLAEGYVSVSDRVVSVSDRVASVSGRVVSVSDRLVSVSDRVDSVSDRVDSVSDRVDSLSTDVKGIAYALDSLVARLEAKNVI